MIESASFILLLLAMVVKYGFDEPVGVDIMGPVHGVLFLIYVGVTLVLWKQLGWTTRKALTILVASVIPVAGYVVGHRIIKEETEAGAATAKA
jgi:integral membrane protein